MPKFCLITSFKLKLPFHSYFNDRVTVLSVVKFVSKVVKSLCYACVMCIYHNRITNNEIIPRNITVHLRARIMYSVSYSATQTFVLTSLTRLSLHFLVNENALKSYVQNDFVFVLTVRHVEFAMELI